MAQIAARNDVTVLKIDSFLGLNENLDGDTTLKTGEMAEMRNFRITQERHLQIRPGCKTILSLHDALEALGGESIPDANETRIRGVWRGTVGGAERVLAAYGGHIWEIDLSAEIASERGAAEDADTSFFAFGGKVYLLNGTEYKSWDGNASNTFEDVVGYIPLVLTATTPAGAGTQLENVNRLTNKRRVQFSPDGTATEFHLPEGGIGNTVTVKLIGQETTAFSVNTTDGIVTMTTAPAAGTNTMEVTYSKGDGARAEVTGMRFAELFNGAQDTRVFLYGDGTNRTIYSGIDGTTGEPSAEYFPDLFELTVGEKNTPITALVRHFARMMAFKPSSAWVIQFGDITLEDGRITPAFYTQPVNRQFGNDAPGQVKLLENNPLTLDVGSVYQWQPTSSYGNITSNDNNAKRVSDRVAETLRSFDLKAVKTFNIKYEHEYWFMNGGTALILNYANDTWYVYKDLPFRTLIEAENEKYGIADNGDVMHFSRQYRNDNNEAINCYAATGAMDFDKDWLLKYSPMIFVAMQPESNARIYVTAESNRRSDYPDKVVAYNLATFEHVDFNHFSFATNRKPQVKRVKMKVKKATFYRLIFKSNSASATATVIETDVRLRYAGNVK